MINKNVAELIAKGINRRTAYRWFHPGKKQMNPIVRELIESGVNYRTAYRRARGNGIASRKTSKPIYTFSKGEYV